MKFFLAVPVALFFFGIIEIQAGIVPTAKLSPEANKAFDDYVARHEADTARMFAATGAMWMDGASEAQRRELFSGKPFSELRNAVNFPTGQIQDLFGTVRVEGVTLASVLRTMQSYSRYPEFFKPDIAKTSAKEQPDSKPGAQHFDVTMQVFRETSWMDVAFDTDYDTVYQKVGADRATTVSRSKSIREYRDAHKLQQGTLPEGEDHGFLWRTYTAWTLRERDGGVDMEVHSFSLSRSIPSVMSWWANKTSRSTAEKIISQTADAVRRRGPNNSD